VAVVPDTNTEDEDLYTQQMAICFVAVVPDTNTEDENRYTQEKAICFVAVVPDANAEYEDQYWVRSDHGGSPVFLVCYCCIRKHNWFTNA